MIKKKKDLNLKILIDNDNYVKKYKVDNNESVTPTTDKGYFSFTNALEKINSMTTENQDSMEETYETPKLDNETKEPTELEKSLEDALYLEEQGIFVKRYAYDDDNTGNSKVLRFGINTKKKELINTIENYNKLLQENVKKIVASNKKLSYLEKMSNISGETNYKKFVNYIIASDIEKDIVNHAIKYLKDTNSKTVLVDVLPRVLNSKAEKAPVGTIKNLETHTALLYYNGKNVLVIDPNNPQFSAFLENVSPEIIRSSYRADDKIYTRHGDPGPDSWRDCIDIAVKLAFVLNSSKENYQDIESIIKSNDIKSLSNNDFYDKNIFYNDLFDKDYDKYELHSKDHHIRNKQTSNLKDVNSFNKNLSIYRKLYDDAFSILRKYVSLDIVSKLSTKMKEGFIKMLSENKTLIEDQLLLQYITECKLNNIENIEQDLSGAIEDYFKQCEG